jgi:hypothetical protein
LKTTLEENIIRIIIRQTNKMQKQPTQIQTTQMQPDPQDVARDVAQDVKKTNRMNKMKETTDLLNQTLLMAEENVVIGKETTKDLDIQNEKLKNVGDNLDHINGSISRSNRTITKLNRKWYDPRYWF